MCIDQDIIDKQLEIDTSSPYNFEQTLKNHAILVSFYTRAAAKAQKRADDLKFQFELKTSEIVENIKENAVKPIPASGWAEIRKTQVPLNKEYQILLFEYNEAIEIKNILYGVISALEQRGYRLQEIAKLSFSYLRRVESVSDILELD